VAKKAKRLAYGIAADIISRIGISKAAGAGVFLDDVAAEFLPMTREYVQLRKQARQLRKQTRQLGNQASTAATPGFIPLDPREWQAELVRRVPPRRSGTT
jgi:hypothetical protein